MANCYLGKPLAFSYRIGINSAIPREFNSLLPGLASGYVTVQSVPAGYMLRPATSTDKGARKLNKRIIGWRAKEGMKLLAQLNDAMAVVTTVGVLMTSKDKLPLGWDVNKLSEIAPSHFNSPGRETRSTRLFPVVPQGLSFKAEWAKDLGLNVKLPLYLARRKMVSGATCFVLTTRKEGKMVGQWEGDVFKLDWKHISILKAGHSVQVRGITGYGWIIRSSARSQLLGTPEVGTMPNLKKETVIGKQEAGVLCQRGSIPYCEVPQTVLRSAGFSKGDTLAVKRLPGGGVKLVQTEKGIQRIRSSHNDKEGACFRLGVKDLTWCGVGMGSRLQFIACKGAVYVLRAELANDAPELVRPRIVTPPIVTTMEVALQEENQVAVPSQLMANTQFKPGDAFRVCVYTNHTSIELDARGPWKIAANEDGVAEIQLPRELLFQVASNRMRIIRVSRRRLKFEDARQAA